MRPSTIGAGDSVTRSRIDGIGQQVEGQLGAQHGAAEVHQHDDAGGTVDALDGLHDADRVGPERRVVEAGRDLDPQRAAVQHLRRQRDRGAGEHATVRDDDQADGRSASSSVPDGSPVTSYSARSSLALGRGSVRTASRWPRRAAAPRWWLRGPGGPRCARRDSWPGPCAPASAWSRPGPPRPRRRAASSAAARRPCSASAASSASTAGASASYMVLSPVPALPRSTTPPSPARRAAARSVGVDRVRVAERAAHPQEERPEQRSARAADRGDQRHPDLGEERAGGRRRAASSAATAAFMPRSMFDPWSASPIAASSSVRWSLFSVDQLREAAHPVLEDRRGHVLSQCQMPHLSAAVFTGASQSESSSSSTLSRVTDAPAMSSEVM